MRRVPVTIRAAGGLLAAILTTGASAESTGTERYDADLASSRVTVEGTSTLHDSHVEGHHIGGSVIVQENELAFLWVTSGPSPHTLAPTGHVEIPVTSLTSGKRGMDDTMYGALKTKRHSTITYYLESAQITMRQPTQEKDAGGSLTLETTGVLMVAGVERRMDIPMHVRRLSENRLEISGDISLRMTEFGIDPPRAMLGTLRTGDTVHVYWTWVLVRDRIDQRDGR